MEISYTKTFARDLRKIKQNYILDKVSALKKTIELAKSVNEIKHLESIKGMKNAYRIRVGNYRIGVFIEKNNVEFHRIKLRKDIYKFFPLFQFIA